MSGDAFYLCICDPNDVFEPPDPTPRAVAGCPAHRARRAAQQFIDRSTDDPRWAPEEAHDRPPAQCEESDPDCTCPTCLE